jgi:CHAT domain-containing protein
MKRLPLSLFCVVTLVAVFLPPSQGQTVDAGKISAELKQRIDAIEAEAIDFFFRGDFESAKDKYCEIRILYKKETGLDSIPDSMEGLCHVYLDDFNRALELFNEQIRLYEERDPRPSLIADAQMCIGWALYLKGDYHEAIDYLKKAESSFDMLGYLTLSKGRTMAILGAAYTAIGDHSMALKYLRQVAGVKPWVEDKLCQTRALRYMGNLERSWGNLDAAIKYYEKAVSIGRESKPTEQFNWIHFVDALNELGAAYALKGRNKRARDAFGEALLWGQRMKSRRLITQTLCHIGNLWRKEGNLAEALSNHEEALRVGREAQLAQMIALALIEIGYDLAKSSRHAEAIDHFSQAVETGGPALPLEVRFRLHLGLAGSYETMGEWQRALDHYRRAIESLEGVRLEALTEDRKLGYWQSRADAFDQAVSLLYKSHQQSPLAGFDARAFDYSERSRARAFLDLLAEAKIDLRQGLSPDARREERDIYQERIRINRALLAENLSRTRQAQLERELAATEERLREFQQRVRLENPVYAQIKHPEPVDVEEVKKDLLDDQSLMIEFLLGEKQSFAWAISRSECRMVALPARGIIEKAVRDYRRTISSPPKSEAAFADYRRRASHLYRLLLKPVEKQIHRAHKLIIVPDGILHYLPFESLTAGRAPLAETHAISYSPSASVLALLGREYGGERRDRLELLAYGNPIFSSRQLSSKSKSGGERSDVVRSLYAERGVRFAPLPHTRREVEAIVSQYPRNSAKSALGLEAAESRVKREPLARYRRLHMATHGLIDERSPARSGLVFSLVGESEEDGVLQMSEIFNLRLDAEMVVLSACRTGLGRIVRGEGIVGLTRAFLYARALSVVVSLWDVQDSSTAEFMKRFYRHLRKGRKNSDALRRARMDMIRSDILAYRHPYYWSAFVMAGRD